MNRNPEIEKWVKIVYDMVMEMKQKPYHICSIWRLYGALEVLMLMDNAIEKGKSLPYQIKKGKRRFLFISYTVNIKESYGEMIERLTKTYLGM